MLDFEHLFYKGDMLSSYVSAMSSNAPESKQYITLLEKHLVHKIPKLDEVRSPQSIEYVDESYEEDKWLFAIRSTKDEEQFQNELKSIEQYIQHGTDEERALALYTQGRLFLFSHLYEEAIYSFIQAVQAFPVKALYAGTVGQTMMRLNYSPIEALAYLQLAVMNDEENARWYYCRALLLLQLYKDLHVPNFLDNAIYEMQVSKEKCRAEQKSLNHAIQQLDREIAEILQNY